MNNNEQELAEFWDEFAEEYEEVQQESPFPIVRELRDFLVQEGLFPCQTFLDIAGGTGRYLPFFQEQVTEYTLADISQRMLEIAEAKAQSNVVFLHQSQERLIETGKKFQVVFSAMNPALDTPEKVKALCQLSEEWCLIFRLVEEQDSLFSPFEQESNPQLNWMAKYKAFLKKEQRPFFTKKFFFEASEAISKDFFRNYFEEQWSVPILEQRIQEIFGSHEIKQNQRTIIYELIVIPCKKTTSDD